MIPHNAKWLLVGFGDHGARTVFPRLWLHTRLFGHAPQARLRVIDGIRVSRTRVLRIIGENRLLSPHRRRPRPRRFRARGTVASRPRQPFLSEHFQNQLTFFGMAPSFAFVREPETNGVAERFIRTLKEQVVFGRIFQDIEEVRAAVRMYFDRYNQHWLLEKNGYCSPAQTRRNWMAATITTHEAA
jgi:integrase-like protein